MVISKILTHLLVINAVMPTTVVHYKKYDDWMFTIFKIGCIAFIGWTADKNQEVRKFSPHN